MSLPQPRYPEVGVVGLVPDHWGPHWQPRHFVLTRLAAYFNVVWMNCPHSWRHPVAASRHSRALLQQAPASPAGFHVYQPELWLPRVGRPGWLGRFTSKQRLLHACALLQQQRCTKLALYVWRPEFADALQLAPHDLSIYHVDDDYSFSPVEVQVSRAERSLLERVDQVFIHSPALMDKRGKFNPNTEFVPNGVDYRLHATPAAEPEDLSSIPHPRLGYVGYLKQMLDWQLLQELSAKHPQWSFVFVGPTRPHPAIYSVIEEMSRRPNVHFLGARPVERLAGYAQHFDVCMMPYTVDDYTKYIYPLKMHEYLATGRPVISSPIRSVEAFRHVVTTVSGTEQWSQAIERALGPEENGLGRREQRQAVAREHDWDALVFRIARAIATRLSVDFNGAPAQQGSPLLSVCAPLT